MRIEQHPNGVVTWHIPHGQLRVVRADRLGTDHDRVDQRTQPVQVLPVLVPGDKASVPRARGDEPVQALPELGDGQR